MGIGLGDLNRTAKKSGLDLHSEQASKDKSTKMSGVPSASSFLFMNSAGDTQSKNVAELLKNHELLLQHLKQPSDSSNLVGTFLL